MVFLSNTHPKRTPVQKACRICVGFVAVSLIVYLLSLVPYDILREERFRLYGETRTTGVVTGVRADGDPAQGSRFVIDYKYIDGDGFARQAVALLPEELWTKFKPGSRLEVLFVRSRPHMARIAGEVEPAFQLWLRDVLN